MSITVCTMYIARDGASFLVHRCKDFEFMLRVWISTYIFEYKSCAIQTKYSKFVQHLHCWRHLVQHYGTAQFALVQFDSIRLCCMARALFKLNPKMQNFKLVIWKYCYNNRISMNGLSYFNRTCCFICTMKNTKSAIERTQSDCLHFISNWIFNNVENCAKLKV